MDEIKNTVMTERYPQFLRSLQLSGLAMALLALLFPEATGRLEFPAALLLILLCGIPHGATDYQIFRHLSAPFLDLRLVWRFFLRYLLLMAGYGLLWILLPGLALISFLGLSMYHFGQSNWNYVSFSGSREASLHFLSWGALVITAPVLLHYHATAPIIGGLLRGPAPLIEAGWGAIITGVLLLVNALLIWRLRLRSRLSRRLAREEWLNLAVLTLIFATTPPLLGFAIFFAGWHSLGSIRDQIRFFRLRQKHYSWKDYVRNAFLITAISIGGLGLLIFGSRHLGYDADLAVLFIFISVVTLPHMLLIDRLYHALQHLAKDNSKPVEKQKNSILSVISEIF